MSIARTVGSFAGKSAAYAWEGTRLASSEFAAGARTGYADKAAELQARRLQLAKALPAAHKPVAAAQKKLRTVAA